MNEIFFRDLCEEIFRASLKAAEKTSSGDSSLCAFALYSDEGAMTVLPSANTQEFLTKKQNEDPDDPLYYKWSTAEWKHEYDGAEFFEKISEQLRAKIASLNEDEFEGFRDDLFEACVSVLQRIRQQKIFEDVILVFAVTDFREPAIESEWISKINSESEAEEFADWVQDQ